MGVRTNQEFISLLFLCFVSSSFALYELPESITGAVTVIPNTLEELKSALCEKHKGKQCLDETLKIIKITKTFDFRESEGEATELGCYHRSSPAICKKVGQLKLNVANQCKGLEPVMVTYDKAGKTPLFVGSNKYVIGEKGVAAIIGKGLKIAHANNVFIHGLNITDINAKVMWGGDAVQFESATNVLFDGNYIARIGRQMIVTHYGGSQNITISNNEFDGKSPWANHCDGAHFWLWLFLGQNDTITLVNNTIHDTSGRGPHSTGMNNAKVFLHMISNRFEDISHAGLIESREITSRILAEGNYFKNVSEIVHTNIGPTFLPKTESEADICKEIIGRKCLVNIIDNPKKKNQKKGDLHFKSDSQVLREAKNYNLKDAETVAEQVLQLKTALLSGTNLDIKSSGKKVGDKSKSGEAKTDKPKSDSSTISDKNGICFDSTLAGIKDCRSSILKKSKNTKKKKLSNTAAMEEYEKSLLTCLCEKYMICDKSC